jgi:hypothetical protein
LGLIPSRAKDFSLFTVSTLAETHQASYSVGSNGSLSRTKWLEHEADHSPPSSAEVKNVPS